ncbi:hypothetical protein AVEN_224327-1 [Araneus ventricosus]|uniref:Uncharacterized protein n=1 Tax=Araneus ventricosus TaxID=182803 RepID=A0A4Y2QY53_ARAVE|nr:hypothetical protein AVEN_224327-1 [Araneus ventricosus]
MLGILITPVYANSAAQSQNQSFPFTPLHVPGRTVPKPDIPVHPLNANSGRTSPNQTFPFTHSSQIRTHSAKPVIPAHSLNVPDAQHQTNLNDLSALLPPFLSLRGVGDTEMAGLPSSSPQGSFKHHSCPTAFSPFRIESKLPPIRPTSIEVAWPVTVALRESECCCS